MAGKAQPIGISKLELWPGRHSLLTMLWRDKYALLAGIVLLVVVVAAVGAPVLAPHDPTAQNLLRRLTPPAWDQGGDWTYPLGTDHLGRDVLSRIITSSRISLLVGLAVVLISMAVGVTLGLVGGFFRGRVDEVVQAILDVIMAFPGILLVMAIAAMMGAGLSTVIVALSVRSWTTFARISRGLTMSVREMEYVDAARAMGCTNSRCIFVHVLPNVVSPVITVATLEAGQIILAESAISFLGLGIAPPLSSWGLMVSEGRNYLRSAWWVATLPGLALFITILAMNVLSSFMRLATDPLQRGAMGMAARKAK